MRIHKKEVIDAMLENLKDKKNKLFRPSFEILARSTTRKKHGIVNTGVPSRHPRTVL